MRTKYLVLACILFTTLFYACQKEPDGSILNPGGSNNTCKLDKATYYDDTTGAVADTAGYVYTGDQVTRINHVDFYITLEYSNNKVSKRNLFPSGTTTAVAYDTYTYNADGTINKSQSYYQYPPLPIPILYYSYEYTWSNGKLTNVIEKADTSSNPGGPLISVYSETFTYTGNNITQCIEEDLLGHVKDTLVYNFDNKANYFAKNPALFFTDNLFLDFDPVSLPLVLSSNNVTQVTIDRTNGSAITYTPTDKDLLKEFALDGKRQSSYSYKCQ